MCRDTGANRIDRSGRSREAVAGVELSKMLSQREKEGVYQLLQKMPAEELVHLANTVTNRLIVVQNRKEAMKAISMYSENAEQFLRRKLVKRDLLFTYLADNDIPISPNADKSRIIQEVISYWQSSSVNEQTKESVRVKTPEATSSQDLTVVSQDVSQNISQEVSLSSPDAHRHPSHEAGASSSPGNPSWSQDLAESFASWFFTQLNKLHPSYQAGEVGEWGPQHFLSDASLKLRVLKGGGGGDPLLDTYTGADMVARRLGCLVTEEQLLFNPNLSKDGTQGRSEAHGLVAIAVCGTIHQTNMCLGLFEQQIGLVRDPLAENNWKVKFIHLQIKSGSTQKTPTLESCSQGLPITM